MFNSFSAEIHQIVKGGFHDSFKSNVHFEYRADELVLTHEGIHDKLFKSCPDAQSLGILVATILHDLEYSWQTEKGVIEQLIDWLMESSRMAQEAAATYLSIKGFPPNEQGVQQARLPITYQEWYKVFDDVVTPLVNTSYLQYLLAWQIAIVAFSSPFLKRLFGTPLQDIEGLLEEEKPNVRLESLLSAFSILMENGFGQVMREKATQYMIQSDMIPWDIFVEEEWEAAPDADTVKVELFISSIFKPALKEMTGLDELEYDQKTQEQIVAFYEKAGLKLHLTPPFLSYDGMDDSQQVEALSAAETKVYRTLDNLPFWSLADWFMENKDCEHVTICARSFADGLLILLAFKGQHVYPTRVSSDELLLILANLQLTGVTFLLDVDEMDDVTTWFEEFPWLHTANLEEIIGSSITDNPDIPLEINRYFYVKSNFLDLARRIDSPIISIISDDAVLAGRLFTIKLPITNTYFLRFYNNNAAQMIKAYLFSNSYAQQIHPVFLEFPPNNMRSLNYVSYCLYFFSAQL